MSEVCQGSRLCVWIAKPSSKTAFGRQQMMEVRPSGLSLSSWAWSLAEISVAVLFFFLHVKLTHVSQKKEQPSQVLSSSLSLHAFDLACKTSKRTLAATTACFLSLHAKSSSSEEKSAETKAAWPRSEHTSPPTLPNLARSQSCSKRFPEALLSYPFSVASNRRLARTGCCLKRFLVKHAIFYRYACEKNNLTSKRVLLAPASIP